MSNVNTKCPSCGNEMAADHQGKMTHCGKSYFSWRGQLRIWGDEAKFDFTDLEADDEGRGRAA